MGIKALIEKRNALVEELRQLTEAEGEFNEERFAEIDKELKSLDKQIKARKLVEAEETRSAEEAEPVTENAEKKRADAELRAFGMYVQGRLDESRADTNWTTTANGAVIPKTVANRIIEEIENKAPIFEGASKFYSKGELVFPVYDKTTEITANYANEFSAVAGTAAKFTSVSLNGYLFAALTKLSKSLVNNAAVDVANFVIGKISEAMADFLRGELLTGTSKMHGLLGSTNTVTAAGASAITADDIISTQLAVPQAYQAGAVWLMNVNTFGALKKLKLTTGEYILQMDMTAPMGYTILGKPVILDDKMPDIGKGASPIAFADLSGLYVNIHEDINLQVLLEKYADEHALGYVAWAEMDSAVVEPQKIAVLTNASA